MARFWTRRFAAAVLVVLVVSACLLGGGGLYAHAHAHDAPPGGRVSSVEEGAMEGVLVSARAVETGAGVPVTVTVVSDRDGSFQFPTGKLRPGLHHIAIRAVGYELDAGAELLVGAAGRPLDLRLRKTSDLAAQLTNTEWFISTPGTAEQKRPLIECLSCHTFERIARSTQNAEDMLPVLKRMVKYANNSTMARVQTRIVERGYDENGLRKLAEYLASSNLSKGPQWPSPLKTLPRPTGQATRVLITEYDLPRKTIAPHERGQFHVPGFTLHRRGFVHLPAMTGTGGKEMDHSALQGRFDEIEDLIVKGDRLWSIFTLRAKHVGPIYGRPATGKDLAITEMCCLRFEDGKLAEGWFLGDEVTICRQIGIDVKVPHVSAALPPAEALPAPGGIPGQDAIAARQGPGTDYGKLKSVIARRAAERCFWFAFWPAALMRPVPGIDGRDRRGEGRHEPHLHLCRHGHPWRAPSLAFPSRRSGCHCRRARNGWWRHPSASGWRYR